MAKTGTVWALDFGKGSFSFAATLSLTTDWLSAIANWSFASGAGYRLLRIGHSRMR